MTKRVLLQARELERAAERAGGYVASPGSLEKDEKGVREFEAIRRYSIEHGKPISKLSAEDYRKIGVSPIA